jgi:iron-sulfur cluster repair protein YtfE (RIC family)
MKPSEIRTRLLEDHEGLRADLDRLGALVQRLRDREGETRKLGAVRRDARSLLEKLRAHMSWEETELLPALRDSDAWGSERAKRLISDHREQRALLDFILVRLLDATRPAALVLADVDALIAFLLADMQEEETDLASDRILRDDVTGIEVESG